MVMSPCAFHEEVRLPHAMPVPLNRIVGHAAPQVGAECTVLVQLAILVSVQSLFAPSVLDYLQTIRTWTTRRPLTHGPPAYQ